MRRSDIKVSIITPLHNKGQFLPETVHSVLSQTVSSWEWIVVENGSSDDGPEKIESIRDPRVHLIVSEKLGPGVARNLGIANAVGEWVLFLDGDDCINTEHLSELLKIGGQCPSAGLVVGSWLEFDNSNQSDRVLRKPVGEKLSREALLDFTFAFCPWVVHAGIVRRDCLTARTLWPEAMDRVANEDTVFWHRLICENQVAFAPTCEAVYRVNVAGCRNRMQEIPFWYSSLCAAIDANRQWHEDKGDSLTAGQIEMAMRALSDMALRARRQNQDQIFDEALATAEQWLRLRACLPDRFSVSLRLRSLVGLRSYALLSAALSPILTVRNSLHSGES